MAHAVGCQEHASPIRRSRALLVDRNPDTLRGQRIAANNPDPPPTIATWGREIMINPYHGMREQKIGYGIGILHRPRHFAIACGQTAGLLGEGRLMRSASLAIGCCGRSVIALALALLFRRLSPFGACRRYPTSGKNHRAVRRRRTANAIPRLVGDCSRTNGASGGYENRTGPLEHRCDFVYHSDPDGYTLLSSRRRRL